MRNLTSAAALAAGLVLLTGCGGDSGAGTPTAEENQQLNEAAEMLDTSPDDLVPADEAALGNGEEAPAAGEDGVQANDTMNAQ